MIMRNSRCCSRIALSAVAVAAVLAVGRYPALAANVCVAMSGSNGQVGGLQLDLAWTPGCMSAGQPGSAVACTPNGATGKDVHSNVLGGGASMRALLLSTTDPNPIPDGELFCCQFSALKSPPCCGLGVGNVILSSPTGQRVSGGSVQAFIDNAPCADSSGGGGSQPAPLGGVPVPQAPGAAPVVSVPGGGVPAGGGPAAPAGGPGPAPAGVRAAPNVVQGIAPPPAEAPPVAAEVTPGEAAPAPTSPIVGRPAPTAFPTARPTQAAAAASPTLKVRTPRGTPTAATSPTPAGTKTPKKQRRHKAKPTPEAN